MLLSDLLTGQRFLKGHDALGQCVRRMADPLRLYLYGPTQDGAGMDDEGIRHAEVTSEGLIVTFDDEREGLIKSEDVRDCVEKTGGFEKLQEWQEDAPAED